MHTYERILQAIGQAAVGCTTKDGGFDSTAAIRIAKELYADITLGVRAAEHAEPAPSAAPNCASLPCPDDCEHRLGRLCVLEGSNHCIRRAEDYYRPRQP